MTRKTVALIHHPCLDKAGKIYTTSITNLDVHDIARSARTYDVDAYYIVTPVTAQQELGQAMLDYWKQDKSLKKNADRAEALSRVTMVHTIGDAIAIEEEITGQTPMLFSTSAKKVDQTISFKAAREKIEASANSMLFFGTGHGLHGSVLELSDEVIEPITIASDYNHLSVRSAVAIIFDRLFG